MKQGEVGCPPHIISDKAYLEGIIKIKLEQYSETELHDIADFYRTKSGQKQLKTEPLISQEITTIGKSITESHMSDLTARIKKFKLSKGTDSPH